jgi:hypothetical protein
MKIKICTLAIAALIIPAVAVTLVNINPAGRHHGVALAGQDTGSGFVITLKNGSSVRGRTLTRDQASGTLRLTMTQDAGGQPKSYAIIALDDADSIHASSSDTDSIQVKVRGGSVVHCKEFSLSPDTITLKIGSRSTISVPWDQIESISFAQ